MASGSLENALCRPNSANPNGTPSLLAGLASAGFIGYLGASRSELAGRRLCSADVPGTRVSRRPSSLARSLPRGRPRRRTLPRHYRRPGSWDDAPPPGCGSGPRRASALDEAEPICGYTGWRALAYDTGRPQGSPVWIHHPGARSAAGRSARMVFARGISGQHRPVQSEPDGAPVRCLSAPRVCRNPGGGQRSWRPCLLCGHGAGGSHAFGSS